MYGKDKNMVDQYQQYQDMIVTSRNLHVKIELLMQPIFEFAVATRKLVST